MPNDQALTPVEESPSLVSGREKALLENDLSELTDDERMSFYEHVCKSLNLNPATKPLEYIRLNGKLTLYANKTAANQLRKTRKVSITKLEETYLPEREAFIVRAYAQDGEGRTDVDEGVVPIHDRLTGEAFANARMKAITKAKRRVTLSICGLGFLDETELETIPSAEAVHVNYDSGSVEDYPTRLRQIDAWLAAKKRAQLPAAIDEIEKKIEDWPDDFQGAARKIIREHKPEIDDDDQ